MLHQTHLQHPWPSNIDATLSIGAVFLHEAFHIFVEGLRGSTHSRLPMAGGCQGKGGLGFLAKKNSWFGIANQNLSFKDRVPTLRISTDSCSKLSTNIVLGSLGLFRSGATYRWGLLGLWYTTPSQTVGWSLHCYLFNHPKPSDSKKPLEPLHKRHPWIHQKKI